MHKIASKLKQISSSILTVSILATGTIPNTVHANLAVTGDFRVRLESDWNSHKSDGVTLREDRTRTRIRARISLKYDHEDWAYFKTRLRSGSDDSHQSPHITVVDFDDNDTGDADFNLDQWYFKLKKSGMWMWAGRNGLPLWKQNELVWGDGVTPTGIAVGLKFGSDISVAVNAGYFSLPVGMKEFSGNAGLGQVILSTKAGGVDFTAAAGLLSIESNPDDEDAVMLLKNNGLRDYTILITNLQAKFNLGGLPLKIGADWIHNYEDYDDVTDNYTYTNRNETDGYIGSIHLGKLTKPGDWLLGYYYAHIETLAVNSSYAQDDYARWGTATQTRLSDMKGHEVRAGYQLTKELNFVARLYMVEAITNGEDGNRFRVDFNYSF